MEAVWGTGFSECLCAGYAWAYDEGVSYEMVS